MTSQNEGQNPKKRPRYYMTWGEPSDDEEEGAAVVPRRTLQRKIKATDIIEEVFPERANLPPVEVGGWNIDDDASLPSRHQEENEDWNDSKKDSPLYEGHQHDEVSSIGTLQEENQLSANESEENNTGSEASTVCVSLSENGDESYVIGFSDDEQELDTQDESQFAPIPGLTQNQEEPVTCEAEHLVADNTSGAELDVADNHPLQVPHLAETSATLNPGEASARPSPFYSTLRMLNKLPAVVTSNVYLSPKEVLLNLLNLNEKHDMNNSIFVGICKLVNSMFSEPILPDTQFKLDELLFSSCGAEYHFYCFKCEKLLNVTNVTDCITCECGYVNNSVSDLTKASFFVTFNVCTQLEILLRDPKISVQLLDARSYRRVGPGMHDLWDGEVYQRLINSLNPDDLAKILSLVLCIDGSPLFKSSGTEIHPLLATVCELPPALRLTKTILLGLWFGKGKPDFKTFLKPLRRTIVNLSDKGANISIGGEKTLVKVKVIGCCVDAALRGPIQGIHLHNGRFGCNWCLHPGRTEGGGSSARKYEYLEPAPALRTHNEVVSDAETVKKLPRGAPSAPKPDINGVLGRSPLLKFPQFNIVDGIVLDPMHNFFLGTTRQLLRLWFGLEGNVKLPGTNKLIDYYIGSPSLLAKVNRRIDLLCPPVEVRRLFRSMSDLAFLKSRDLENGLLYFLVPVLNGILPQRFLRHFILYVQSVYLLMNDIILDDDLTSAQMLLVQFVQDIKNLYRNCNHSDLKQYTYNVHISLHAVQNAKNWGPAWSVSGYPYENGIGVLKGAVYANRGIPDQVTRSLCKSTLKDLLSQEIHSAGCSSFLQTITPRKGVNVSFIGNVKVFGIDHDFHPNDEEAYLLAQSSLQAEDFCVARKIIYKSCVYSPRTKEKKTRNDFCQLTDKEIVQIRKIIVSEKFEVVLFFYSIVHVSPAPIYLFPHMSISSPYMYFADLIEEEIHLKPHQILSKPCVFSDLRSAGGDVTISVMANVKNIV